MNLFVGRPLQAVVAANGGQFRRPEKGVLHLFAAPDGLHNGCGVSLSGLKGRVACNPVAHATGRGCAGLPALTKNCNLKKRQRGICVASRTKLRIAIPHCRFGS